MNKIQKQYQIVKQAGRLYSRIENNQYIITFHNIEHRDESQLRKEIYPSLNQIQQACKYDQSLRDSATKHLPLNIAIAKTKDVTVSI